MPFSRFFNRRRFDDAANALYLALVEQSRQPVFYRDLGVADTLEGRYDMIVLHAYMLFRRLGKLETEAARQVSQRTFDFMFADMDQNLREMGVTDMGVGKRVQRMAEAFYGRTAAYDKALAEEGRALQQALSRNLYQGVVVPPMIEDRMAGYVRAQIAHLEGQGEAALIASTISFISPEAVAP